MNAILKALIPDTLKAVEKYFDGVMKVEIFRMEHKRCSDVIIRN